MAREMEPHGVEYCSSGHGFSFSSGNNNPSFSSSLLDAIYRSIDQGGEEMAFWGEDMRAHRGYCSGGAAGGGMADLQRGEVKMGERFVGRRKPSMDLQKKEYRSSSLSASEVEAETSRVRRLKPVRTAETNTRERRDCGGDFETERKSEGGFSKTKSRALKIYRELKKVKQPISPGGKLAGILNNLFAGIQKKQTAVHSEAHSSPNSGNTSTCSSASSFSRLCQSKSPLSSRAAKRSVGFSPANVIADDDSFKFQINPSHDQTIKKPAPNSDNHHADTNAVRNAIKQKLMIHAMEKNRRVHESANDQSRNHRRANFNHAADHQNKPHVTHQAMALDSDSDDDAASDSSSDLFELKNLSHIGIQNYGKELPVYNTTNPHSLLIL